jgi:hypothetical protein
MSFLAHIDRGERCKQKLFEYDSLQLASLSKNARNSILELVKVVFMHLEKKTFFSRLSVNKYFLIMIQIINSLLFFLYEFFLGQIAEVANMSHPINVIVSHQTIDVSSEGIALDRDIILDIDLPRTPCPVVVTAEQYDRGSKLATLTALCPVQADFISMFDNPVITTTEFIFISKLFLHD